MTKNLTRLCVESIAENLHIYDPNSFLEATMSLSPDLIEDLSIAATARGNLTDSTIGLLKNSQVNALTVGEISDAGLFSIFPVLNTTNIEYLTDENSGWETAEISCQGCFDLRKISFVQTTKVSIRGLALLKTRIPCINVIRFLNVTFHELQYVELIRVVTKFSELEICKCDWLTINFLQILYNTLSKVQSESFNDQISPDCGDYFGLVCLKKIIISKIEFPGDDWTSTLTTLKEKLKCECDVVLETSI